MKSVSQRICQHLVCFLFAFPAPSRRFPTKKRAAAGNERADKRRRPLRRIQREADPARGRSAPERPDNRQQTQAGEPGVARGYSSFLMRTQVRGQDTGTSQHVDKERQAE